jgi:glycosyltransferase involved in cell wall biosynthesis
MRIVQISPSDEGGGGEQIAHNLFRAYRDRGHGSWLLVGARTCSDADVIEIPQSPLRQRWRTLMGPFVAALAESSRRGAVGKAARNAGRMLGDPLLYVYEQRGREPMLYCSLRRLLALIPETPDVVHCHNLHGSPLSGWGYFHLRVLPMLSHDRPVVLTLHDDWMLTGHCAYSLGCERWRRGCGCCPDLSTYPALFRDGTRANWKRKQVIYGRGRFYVATPSRWLMRRVQGSMLAPALVQGRVIANGVDLGVFSPGDKKVARLEAGLPLERPILLSVGYRIRRNPFKNLPFLIQAVREAATHWRGPPLLYLVLGDDGDGEVSDRCEIRYVAFAKEPSVVARYYQAADVMLHAARADTFPTTVLEALACGVPVVATDIGGVPEQISDGCNGFLVPANRPEDFARLLIRLLEDRDLRLRVGQEAFEDARQRFDCEVMVSRYLDWYATILAESARTFATR